MMSSCKKHLIRSKCLLVVITLVSTSLCAAPAFANAKGEYIQKFVEALCKREMTQITPEMLPRLTRWALSDAFCQVEFTPIVKETSRMIGQLAAAGNLEGLRNLVKAEGFELTEHQMTIFFGDTSPSAVEHIEEEIAEDELLSASDMVDAIAMGKSVVIVPIGTGKHAEANAEIVSQLLPLYRGLGRQNASHSPRVRELEEKLFDQTQGLIISVLQNVYGLEQNDSLWNEYYQDASIALLDSFRTYTPSKGEPLEKHAWYRVYYSFLKTYYEHIDRAIYVPPYIQSSYKRMLQVEEELRQTLGIEPRAEEVDEVLLSVGMAESEIRLAHLVESASHISSLSKRNNEAPEEPAVNFDLPERLTPFLGEEVDQLELSLWKEAVRQELRNHLSDQEFKVIELYYGLNGIRKHTWDEVSEIIGGSGERARNIREEALWKLYKHHERELLYLYIVDRFDADEAERRLEESAEAFRLEQQRWEESLRRGNSWWSRGMMMNF